MAEEGNSIEESTALLGTQTTAMLSEPSFVVTSHYERQTDGDGDRDNGGQAMLSSYSGSGSYSNDFIKLESSLGSFDNASETLKQCQDWVVRPYNILLKLVGWRKIFDDSKCSTVINCIYPSVIFMMIFIASVAQVLSCFDRSKSKAPMNSSLDNSSLVLSCERNIFTYDVISYMLMLIAYVFSLYTFRVNEPEHLSSLTESVFLSFHDVNHSKSRKKPFFILLVILGAGLIYLMASIGISVLRLFALGLDSSKTRIGWFSEVNINGMAYDVLHYSLVGVAFFGFLFFDFLYIAVMINYCSQCQLLTFYIDNIRDKVRNKKYDNLNLAMKEINKIHGFLKILNGRISVIASLIFFILLSNLMQSYSDLTDPDQRVLNIVTGFLSTIQWLITVLFPAFLAARLTASGNKLRRLGQEIAARPFYYSDTPDLELQFFLLFTESTRYEVNLAFIPMQPSLVFGICFFVLLFMSSGVIIRQVDSVKWF